MEKAVLMMDYLNVTQGAFNNFSHKGDCALDIAGKDSGRDDLRAPFTGTVKRTYSNCNAVWLESNKKVKYADGTEDYMTLLVCHDNSITSLPVGKVIKQGDVFYQEGTKGYATGNHIHLTISKGKFTGSGWHQNEYGTWVANNQYSVHKGLFLDSKTKVINDGGYKWVKTDKFTIDEVTPKVERDDSMEQVEVLVEQLRVRKEPNLKGEVIGYAAIGFYNVLDKKEADGYLWVKIADNQWIASNDKDGWTKIYTSKDYKKLYEDTLAKNKALESEVNTLKSKIDKAIKDLA